MTWRHEWLTEKSVQGWRRDRQRWAMWSGRPGIKGEGGSQLSRSRSATFRRFVGTRAASGVAEEVEGGESVMGLAIEDDYGVLLRSWYK